MDSVALPGWLSISLLVIEYVIKVVAVGVVPENRRPSSSQAWLLLILLLPLVGLPLFLLIGSPYIQGRRHKLQADANELILERTKNLPALPAGMAATRPDQRSDHPQSQSGIVAVRQRQSDRTVSGLR